MRSALRTQIIPGIGTPSRLAIGAKSDSARFSGYVCRVHCDLNSTPYNWQPATFTTTFEVPHPPEENNGQAVFIFPGMQGVSSEMDEKARVKTILQPVLEWNNDKLGEWKVRSWVVKGTREAGLKISARSMAHTLKPGEKLTAYISYWGANGPVHSYSCGFDGIDSVNLDVAIDFKLNEVGVAMEVADISKTDIITELPAAMEICFSETQLVLDGTSAKIDLIWDVVPSPVKDKVEMSIDSKNSIKMKLKP